MELAFNIAATILSLASLVGMVLIARGNWSREERKALEDRVSRIERDADTVNERIKDAVHTRVKIGDYMKFQDDTRTSLQNLTWAIKDGLHERLSKAEFHDFKREMKGRKE